jgi:hypothetical protein
MRNPALPTVALMPAIRADLHDDALAIYKRLREADGFGSGAASFSDGQVPGCKHRNLVRGLEGCHERRNRTASTTANLRRARISDRQGACFLIFRDQMLEQAGVGPHRHAPADF